MSDFQLLASIMRLKKRQSRLCKVVMLMLNVQKWLKLDETSAEGIDVHIPNP